MTMVITGDITAMARAVNSCVRVSSSLARPNFSS